MLILLTSGSSYQHPRVCIPDLKQRTYLPIKGLFFTDVIGYHFWVRFCNPYSGWEKGNVDYNRANLFIPVPRFTAIEKYNQKLFLKHEKKTAKLHYKRQMPIRELFEEDRKAFLMLSLKRFNGCRYEWLKADGYEKVCMDGKHFYSTLPENANQKVLVGIHAHTVDILTEGGQITTTHRRAFGKGRTNISNHSTTLAVLLKNFGARRNSELRRDPPDVLRTYMDAQPKEKLKDCLRIMNELTNQHGFYAAASAMEMACTKGNINICDASVLAARITGYGIDTPVEAGPSPEAYDEAFRKKEAQYHDGAKNKRRFLQPDTPCKQTSVPFQQDL